MANTSPPPTWSNSEAYDALMGRWSRPAAVDFVDWLEPAPGLAWLDVGCGPGGLTQAILDSADPGEILGVDPSAEFIAIASERIRDERVRFAAGNAQALPAPSDHYDAVASGLVLHFLPDPQAAVVEMARTARGGGFVAAYIWDVGDDRQFTRPFWNAAKALDPVSTAAWDLIAQSKLLQLEQLSELFEEAGLERVVVERIDVPTVFRDFDDYWQPCLLDGPTPVQRYARSLTAAQQKALAEQLRSMLPIADDGSISLLGRLLIARGTKPI